MEKEGDGMSTHTVPRLASILQHFIYCYNINIITNAILIIIVVVNIITLIIIGTQLLYIITNE